MVQFDAIIVGGGSAGLSAALVLGRARRRVLVIDGGSPRNAPAEAAHGFFTRDGTPPLELLALGRAQLTQFPTVEIRMGEATNARLVEDGFELVLADGTVERARRLLIATGVRDELPEIPGLRDLWGRGVFHCPYCHGWEVRDRRLAAYANGAIALHIAPLIRNWSADTVLLTDGPVELELEDRERLTGLGIVIREERIARIEGVPDRLERIVFEGGEALERDGLFVRPQVHPRTDLAEQLGCVLVEDGPIAGLIVVDPVTQATSVPGVYAAGDVATMMQQVSIAVASGATAAAMINHGLVAQGFVAA